MNQLEIDILQCNDFGDDDFTKAMGLFENLWNNHKLLPAFGDYVESDQGKICRIVGRQFTDTKIIIWIAFVLQVDRVRFT